MKAVSLLQLHVALSQDYPTVDLGRALVHGRTQKVEPLVVHGPEGAI